MLSKDNEFEVVCTARDQQIPSKEHVAKLINEFRDNLRDGYGVVCLVCDCVVVRGDTYWYAKNNVDALQEPVFQKAWARLLAAPVELPPEPKERFALCLTVTGTTCGRRCKG